MLDRSKAEDIGPLGEKLLVSTTASQKMPTDEGTSKDKNAS